MLAQMGIQYAKQGAGNAGVPLFIYYTLPINPRPNWEQPPPLPPARVIQTTR